MSRRKPLGRLRQLIVVVVYEFALFSEGAPRRPPSVLRFPSKPGHPHGVPTGFEPDLPWCDYQGLPSRDRGHVLVEMGRIELPSEKRHSDFIDRNTSVECSRSSSLLSDGLTTIGRTKRSSATFNAGWRDPRLSSSPCQALSVHALFHRMLKSVRRLKLEALSPIPARPNLDPV